MEMIRCRSHAGIETSRCRSRHTYRHHRSTCMPRSSAEPQSSISEVEFYNRDFETEKLRNRLCERPNSIEVILGPRSCGKSAFLKERLKSRANVIYLNCRVKSLRTPEAFATAVLKVVLLKSPLKAQDAVVKILQGMLETLGVVMSGVKVSWTDVELPVLKGKEGLTFSLFDSVASKLKGNKQPDPPPELNAVYEAISEILDTWNTQDSSQAGYEWPVLVIDEANKLQEWRDQLGSELRGLLSFLVFISKESRRCHVILATSEYGFQAWLNTAIGPRFWQANVIGDFTENHAREFLETLLQKDNASNTNLDDCVWRRVYEVCGGNAGDLTRLAARIGKEDLEIALQDLWSGESERLRKLALGVRGAWTAAQYAEVVLQLLNARHHVLPAVDVEFMLGRRVLWWKFWDAAAQRQAGEQVLQQLVKADALSVRPISAWAQDIPMEAFGGKEAVVTAPSSMSLYCMSRLFKKA